MSLRLRDVTDDDLPRIERWLDAEFVMACVRLDNLASQRAFAKAGFRKDREFDDVPNGLHVLMVRHRREERAA